MNIELDNIQRIANQVVDIYRQQLEAKGINASGTLSQTAQCIVELNGDKLLISLNLEPYWRYVEYGRRPGKMPPIDSIKNWIEVKPVVPDARSGKVPTTNQLAFLIARKIGREGIPARRPLEAAVYSDEMEMVIQAIKAEVINQLRQQL